VAENRSEKTANLLSRVISIVNQKGGVGKSTTAINLSTYLSHAGYRTLLIDLDPQGNSTTGLGVYLNNNHNSIYDVLINYYDPNKVIKSTQYEYLDILPSSTKLAGAEIELISSFKREYRLKNAIDNIVNLYDYIIIDCLPALGLLTLNALAASREVVIPIQCEYYALEGIAKLIETINLVKRNLNPELEISGVVLTMYSKTRLANQAVKKVHKYFARKVYKTVIPRNVRLAEAPSHGKSILTYDPKCAGAAAYSNLAKEIINNNNRKNRNIKAGFMPERIKNFWGSGQSPRHAAKKRKYLHQKV
jgi:chromosome partitioning protein